MSRTPRDAGAANFIDPSYTSHRLRTDDCGEPPTSQPRRLAFSVVGPGSSVTYQAPRGQVEMLRDRLTEWLTATEPRPYRVVPGDDNGFWRVVVDTFRATTGEQDTVVLARIIDGRTLIPFREWGSHLQAVIAMGGDLWGEAIDALRDAYAEENGR